MILTEEEVKSKKHLIQKIELDASHFDEDKHHDKYELKKELFGKYFLYETLIKRDNENYVSYPKLGLFINTYLLDMAVEVEWVDVRRTWEYNLEYSYEHKGQTFTDLAAEIRSEFRHLVIWSDYLYIYGSWDVKPTYKELRPAYENTLWFGRSVQDKRDISLKRLLK